MKKYFSLIFLFMLYPLFSVSMPENLEGIWEGKDRFVFFESTPEEQGNKIVILLKNFYGWYYDRAAEPESYAEKENRIRNDSTSKKAEQIFFNLNPQTTNDAWEITFEYSRHEQTVIPVCIINDTIYLNYYIQDKDNPEYYRGNAVSKGVTLDSQNPKENISCLYICGDKFFDVRYWKTDMEYSSDKANLNFEGNTYFVDKHIFSCGNNYSCTSGRSKIIRNVVEPFDFKEEDFVFNEDKTLMAVPSSLYLVKLADKKTFENLMEIVKTGNSRIRPPEPPLFEPKELDWHWDLIDELEKNNEIIQAVRERQKAFGPRGKDFGK
ncbi:MAG: hypothetical protein PUC37_00495 [Spirochaetales bacterium]|nr:hypothetical protein [Spirochaetales bacterium]